MEVAILVIGFPIAIIISYILLFQCVLIVGVIASIIGYFAKKNIRQAWDKFFDSKNFRSTVIFVFCQGLICALVDSARGFDGFVGLIVSLWLLGFATLYLCGVLTYFIFRRDA